MQKLKKGSDLITGIDNPPIMIGGFLILIPIKTLFN